MTCAIRSLGRHDNQAFIQISHVAGSREHRKHDRLDCWAKEPRRRLVWLRRQRRRETAKSTVGEPKSRKEPAACQKSTHTMAPTRKTSVEMRWWRRHLTVNTGQGR